jgi:hypothetical protein
MLPSSALFTVASFPLKPGQVSISPILYKHIFRTKVFAQLLCAYNLGFVILWQKDLGAKAVIKMLVKLTPGDLTGWKNTQLTNLRSGV